MQAQAAEFSGFAGRIPLLFGGEFKNTLFDAFILKHALKWAFASIYELVHARIFQCIKTIRNLQKKATHHAANRF